ncbi:MAG: GGDEF domain-containing protein [Lautropia sp.]
MSDSAVTARPSQREQSSSADVLREVLKLMSVHASDYLPQTYALWHAFAQRSNAALVAALTPIVASGNRLTRPVSDELYRALLEPRSDPALDETRQMLMQAIDTMSATIDDAASSNARFTGHLTEFSQGVATCRTPGALEQYITMIAEQARRSADELAHVQQKLQQNETELRQMNQDLAQVREEVFLDVLSGLPNRRRFEVAFTELSEAAQRSQTPLTLLLIDIDQFKSINDRHGHPLGDRVIESVGAAIKASVKPRDVAARYGGDEFAVLLPAISAAEGTTIGEYIRRIVERTRIPSAGQAAAVDGITVSIGVANLRSGESSLELLRRADGALYTAKRSGRNRVQSVD